MKTGLKGLLLPALSFICVISGLAQVAISTDGSAPASSAMLEVRSAGKGFLLSRVSLASATDVTTVPAPATGLLVFNINQSMANGGGTGFYYYNGTKWVKLAGGTTHYIGELYGGGNIFWLDETGEHGLVAATADLSTDPQWYNGTFKVAGANADGVYAGKYNTDKIIASQGAGTYAAILCRDYTYTSGNVFYNDWYLPSKYELNLMYLNRALLAPFNTSYGIYWSSTEGTSDPLHNAFDQVFMNGSDSGLQEESQKDWTDQVRCIRKF